MRWLWPDHKWGSAKIKHTACSRLCPHVNRESLISVLAEKSILLSADPGAAKVPVYWSCVLLFPLPDLRYYSLPLSPACVGFPMAALLVLAIWSAFLPGHAGIMVPCCVIRMQSCPSRNVLALYFMLGQPLA